MVSGYAHNYDGHTLTFKADAQDLVKNLSEGTVIDYAAIKTASEMEAVKARVKECSDELVLEIC